MMPDWVAFILCAEFGIALGSAMVSLVRIAAELKRIRQLIERESEPYDEVEG